MSREMVQREISEQKVFALLLIVVQLVHPLKTLFLSLLSTTLQRW
jgi:hypothetical protein